MINEGCYTASSEATNLIGDANSSLKKPSVQPCYPTETNISNCKEGPGLVDLHSGFTHSTRNEGRPYSVTTSFNWKTLRENRGGFQNTVNPMKPQRIVQSHLPTPKTYCETYCETCETGE